jgi:hypothetical protein
MFEDVAKNNVHIGGLSKQHMKITSKRSLYFKSSFSNMLF